MTRRQPLLIAGCLLGSMGMGANAAQPQAGVAFAGDMQSIDRAMLEAADLPLPAMASGPVLSPRTAPSSGVVQASASNPIGGRPAFASNAVHQAGVAPSSVDQPEQKKSSFFSKLKPKWMFGGDEKKETAVDPFAAAVQDSRIQAVGAATHARNEGVERIPSYIPAHTPQRVANSPASANSRSSAPSQPKLTPTPAKPSRPDGLVLRRSTGPKQGLLSGLWGSNEEKPLPKPQPQIAHTMSRQPTPAPARIATTQAPQPMRTASAPTPSPSYLTDDVQHIVPAKKPAAKATMSSAGVVMVSDDAAPTAKRSPIAQVSPEKPLTVANDLGAKKPTIVNLTKSEPKASTLENHFATAKPSVEPTAPAVIVGDNAPGIAKSTPAPAAEPKSPAPMSPAATGPVVVSLPPRPTPAPLPSDESAQELTPAAQTPATYANTAANTAASRQPSAATVETSERAKSLLAEAHQLAATASTADEYSAVLKRCRYVLAIDGSEQAVAYANQLSGWALAKRGEAFDNEGRSAEAVADYQDALRCDSECWRAEHALGVIAARSGDAEEAFRRFNRTLLLNPEFAKAYSNRAALAVQKGDFETALRDYQTAIEIDPDLEPAHTGRGRVCHMLGLLDEGLQHLDAAELLAPEDAMIATGRGDLLVDLGRYGQAKAAYERAIALDPQNAAAYRNLAWMQATCPVAEFRDGAAAVNNIQHAEQLAGGADDLTLDTKAAALAAAGRFEEAAQVQQQAIESAPAESDAAAYRERLALYQQGATFTSQPVALRQATYMR